AGGGHLAAGAVGDDDDGAPGVDGELHAAERHRLVRARGEPALDGGQVQFGEGVVHGGGGDQAAAGAAVNGQRDGPGVTDLDAGAVGQGRLRGGPDEVPVAEGDVVVGEEVADGGGEAAH